MDAIQQQTIVDEVLDFLTGSPTPSEIIKFHASEAAQMRLRYLLDQNRAGLLTDSQRAELDEIGHIEHFFTMVKARALKRMNKDLDNVNDHQ